MIATNSRASFSSDASVNPGYSSHSRSYSYESQDQAPHTPWKPLHTGLYKPINSEHVKSFQPAATERKAWERPEESKGDFDANWYETTFVQLFTDVFEFCDVLMYGRPFQDRELFPLENILQFEAPLRNYIEAVASPDPATGQWDGLFFDPQELCLLMRGIIMKYLVANVLEVLLFGSDGWQEIMVKEHDLANINYDGYHRSHSRSKIIRGLLDMTALPPKFHHQLSLNAVQLMTLLTPIFNWAGAAWPSRWPSQNALHQKLYEIVRSAASLSLTIRCAESIFYYDFPTPGDRLQPLEQNAMHSVFLRNKAAALEMDLAVTKGTWVPDGVCLAKKMIRYPAETAPLGAPDRVARGKIIVSPRICRWTPTWRKNTVVHAVQQEVLAPYVAYYWGLADENQDRATRVPLKKYLQHMRDQNYGPAERWCVLVVTAFWVSLLARWLFQCFCTPASKWFISLFIEEL